MKIRDKLSDSEITYLNRQNVWCLKLWLRHFQTLSDTSRFPDVSCGCRRLAS